MGRVVKYEVVESHRCPKCGRVYGQMSKSAAWIGQAFGDCAVCDLKAAALLVEAYRAGLKVTFIERGAGE